jgi:hypothetical protein
MAEVTMAVLITGGLFVAMLFCLEAGRRFGVRRLATTSAAGHGGTGVVEGAILALLGLLMAFAFSGAATRFETRRQHIVHEANAIGTAYLRLDLLAPEAQGELRGLFRDYMDARLAAYGNLPWVPGTSPEYDRSEKLLSQIWQRAVASLGRDAPTATTTLLLNALNEMIDVTTVRMVAIHTHAPVIIFALLIALALISALVAGAGMGGSGRPEWMHMVCFALTMAATVYLIIDLDAPRQGLIRIDRFDEVLYALRASMK